jgi:ABC-type phosphate/phosphonate transport system permease subunit
VRGFTAFLRDNPQVLILLIICVVLGLGTFVVVLLGVASSGSTTTNGFPQDVILGAQALLG